MPNASTEEENLKETQVEIDTCQDVGFMPNQKFYSGSLESQHQKFTDSLQLTPEQEAKKPDLFKVFYGFIFARLKDQQFEDVNWKEIKIDELELPIELSEEARRQWFLLVVLYCRHLWGHLTYVGADILKRDCLEILGNFYENKQRLPLVLKNKLLAKIISGLHTNSSN